MLQNSLSLVFVLLASHPASAAVECRFLLDSFQERDSSYADQMGSRRDDYFSVTIENEVWANTILPKNTMKTRATEHPGLEITRGNAPFPEIKLGDEYVTYFDNMEIAEIKGSRAEGSISIVLKSGISFQMRFEPGMRRKFELWVHGLTGANPSIKILSARSGIEMYM